MKLTEVQKRFPYSQLIEDSVDSSWIAHIDGEYQDDGTFLVIMTTLDGREYELYGVSKQLYSQWLRAPSKGKFWWTNVRDLVS